MGFDADANRFHTITDGRQPCTSTAPPHKDRPYLQYATRELAKGVQNPSEDHHMQLKRVARYAEVSAWGDADLAACVRSRKVSGEVHMLRSNMIMTHENKL